MGRKKKEVVEEVVEVQEVVNDSNVEVHLDRDLNDPRNKPVKDMNNEPVVDINIPRE